MQFHVFQCKKAGHTETVTAIRDHWGKEEAIYQAVQNAFVMKLMDHLFLFPLTAPPSFIPYQPTVVIDGILYGSEDSCQMCKHRLQQVTSQCDPCIFSPLQAVSSLAFSEEGLENLFKEEKAEAIDILRLMAKQDIYQLYFLYHFKTFYENEMPITRPQFLEFITQFDVDILFQNEQEVIIRKNGYYYETTFQKGYVEEKLNRTDLEGLKWVYETIKTKRTKLQEKENLLRTIIGDNV